MGEAMLRGWLESGTVEAGDVVVSDRDAPKAEQLRERYGVTAAPTNQDAVAGSMVVVLAVKPQDSAGVLGDIKELAGDDTVVMSIVAGLTIGTIRQDVGDRPSVVRVMPNMAASVGAAMSVLVIDPGYGELDREMVINLLRAIGEAVEVKEELMDLATALSGSGPAYFFLLVEAMEQAGVKEGMPPEISRKLARETLWGAAKVLKETGGEPAVLRESVSSPGGTTLAALEVLVEEGFEQIVGAAVSAARRRAGELAG